MLAFRPLVWLSLVAYVLTTAIWAPGLVLCLEADGHVSIELAAEDCLSCCPEEGAEEPGEQSWSSCPCLDLVLSGVGVALKKEKTCERERVALQGSFEAQGLVAERRIQTALPRSHASAALPLLRTVVLLV
jgi:hypothetical protein